MSVTDKIEETGIRIEDLNAAEKATYDLMLKAVTDSQLTPEKLKDYILSMRDAVENELVREILNTTQDIFLKARLRNYMLLESFLLSPEKAKQALEASIADLVPKKS